MCASSLVTPRRARDVCKELQLVGKNGGTRCRGILLFMEIKFSGAPLRLRHTSMYLFLGKGLGILPGKHGKDMTHPDHRGCVTKPEHTLKPSRSKDVLGGTCSTMFLGRDLRFGRFSILPAALASHLSSSAICSQKRPPQSSTR